MNLPGPLSGGGTRQDFWCEQGDAAALVDADSKVDGGGGAGVLQVARKKMRRKGSKWRSLSGLFITRHKISNRHENRGVQSGKGRSCRLDFCDDFK